MPEFEKGKYACLDDLAERYGVYIFHCNSEVLYVGESHKQDLKTRIVQHYRPRDRGGNFRINYCKEHCNTQECHPEKKACKNKDELSFKNFKCLVQSSQILPFCIDVNANDVEDKILAFEYELIYQLEPRYNAEIQPKMRVRTTYGPTYIEENVKHIRSNIPQ